MDRKKGRRYIAILSTLLTLSLTSVGLTSDVWTKTAVRGNVTETEGIFRRCTTVCVFIQNPTKWRSFVWYTSFTFVTLTFFSVFGQLAGLIFDLFTASVCYGVCYSFTALSGFILLVIYPTHVKPLGKEELIHVALGWGYYTFFMGVCSMITLSVQCLEMGGTASYPTMGIELQCYNE